MSLSRPRKTVVRPGAPNFRSRPALESSTQKRRQVKELHAYARFSVQTLVLVIQKASEKSCDSAPSQPSHLLAPDLLNCAPNSNAPPAFSKFTDQGMKLKRSLRQGASLALLVLCLAVSTRAATQSPTSGWTSRDIGAATLRGGTGGTSDGVSVWGAAKSAHAFMPLSGTQSLAFQSRSNADRKSIESDGASSGESTSTSDNGAPLVSLTSPASGSTFSAPATFTLTATASGSEGDVAVVEFYSGSDLVGADTTSPYSVPLYDIPSGTYSFTVVARDWSGAMTVSSERVVYVGTASRTAEAFFTPSANHDSTVSHYVLNLFYVGADPYAANPVASVNLGLPPIVNGEAYADITAAVSALSPGNYFVTVTAVGYGGEATSAPSPAFSR